MIAEIAENAQENVPAANLAAETPEMLGKRAGCGDWQEAGSRIRRFSEECYETPSAKAIDRSTRSLQ